MTRTTKLLTVLTAALVVAGLGVSFQAAQAKEPPASCENGGASAAKNPNCEGEGRGRDSDGDGLANSDDNCPPVANPGQEDADADGVGDPCDEESSDADCADGVDNDGDGSIDGDDSDCPVPPPPGTCDDGLDNDGDGPSDAADSECINPLDGVEDGSDVTEPAGGSCATGGAADGGATIAEQLAGPGLDETGELSGQVHAQEGQAGPLGPVVHEAGCVAAALEGQQPPAAPQLPELPAVPPAPELPEVPPPS